MEKYIKLLSNIIDNNNLPKVEASYLDRYFKLVDNNFLETLNNNNKAFYNLCRKIEEAYKIRINKPLCNPDIKIVLQKLIAAIITIKGNNKTKLIPLIIYLDYKNILYNYLIKKGFTNDLKQILIHILKGMKLIPDKHDISPFHWEAEAIDRYKQGIKNINIKDIYDFVNSFERGIGIIPNGFINFSAFVLSEIDLDNLVILLDERKDTITFIYLLYNVPEKEKLKIAAKSNNILLKFEVIREALHFQKQEPDENEKILIEKIILDFSKNQNIWEQFLEFYVTYPLRYPQLFQPLGRIIEKLNIKQRDTLLNYIKIDNHYDADSQKALNSCFTNISNEELQKEILKNLFNRWKNFIDNYNDFFTAIILTDIINIAVATIKNCTDKNDIIYNLKQIVNNLNEIDNRWFKDSMERRNYFYKQMSKLFVYSFGINKYGLKDEKKKIQNICNTSLELKYEQPIGNNKTTLQLFNQYID
ncbi:MAG: hypothetical protein JRJ49_01910 [Deltaproteobacteria bacterium]|nr:hypothetical protein [Deltaproteobacteria bacterium]